MNTAARRASVAIVDDDPSIRRGLRRLCELSGFVATVYASGPEFLAAFEHDRSIAECLILDTHMPGMSGNELQRHLLANGVTVPIVVVTADDTSDAHAHYAPGIVAYLQKPVAADDLLAAINMALAATSGCRDAIPTPGSSHGP
jgi:FixJ family two-component response regulator